jgi:NAD(P)-dependent dehydrogenase (short-subunit alcohol dehydrogenase family)
MNPLEGTVALISGAGRGQGRKLALALSARGASVAMNDISPLNVEEAAQQIARQGRGQARVYLHDVAKKVAVQSLINQVLDDFGRLDLLVNSANVEPTAGLLEMDEWDLHRVFEVNTIGTFLLMQSAARVMRSGGGGLILNLLGRPQAALAPAYAASRQAVAELTRQTAAELAPAGIRVYGLAWETGGQPDFSDIEQATLALLSQQEGLPPSGALLRLAA